MSEYPEIAKRFARDTARPHPTQEGRTKDLIEFADERLPERFWAKVRVTESGCWEWTASVNNYGYGKYKKDGRDQNAHRVAYTTLLGPTRDGLIIRHDCDNPPCVNPNHMSTGTQSDNIRDCVSRGRHTNAEKTHCRNGHPFSGTHLYVNPTSGRRHCRSCKNEAQRRRRRRNIGTKPERDAA